VVGSFEVTAQDPTSAARCGRLVTAHGVVETPAFMPVGTQATVKTLSSEDLEELGATMILGNTYHLYLRPGAERIDRLGGLHRFMSWSRGILTDSGGFQVMSLSSLRRVDEDGVTFRSHLDGSTHRLTPERAIQIQELLGSDVAMVLDECLPYPGPAPGGGGGEPPPDGTLGRAGPAGPPAPRPASLRHRPGRHGARPAAPGRPAPGPDGLCRVRHRGPERGRAQRADVPAPRRDHPGAPPGPAPLPDGRGLARCHRRGGGPRGRPLRLGPPHSDRPPRDGFTRQGPITIKNARYAEDDQPIDPQCDCKVCRRYSRAYLRHLFNAGESLGPRLGTYHNLYVLLRLMERIRAAIRQGTFAQVRQEAAALFPPRQGSPGSDPAPTTEVNR